MQKINIAHHFPFIDFNISTWSDLNFFPDPAHSDLNFYIELY